MSMKNLILEIKKDLSKNIYTLEISKEMLKDFQKMILEWCPEDTNVFFHLK